MAMRVLYLDVDDEITSAAARIRGAEEIRVGIVLPHGSRVATSRINFRLLARDATLNGKRLSVVAGDAATRALAASAGLPIFATVAEYETSLEGGGGTAAATGTGEAPAEPLDEPAAPKPSKRSRAAKRPAASDVPAEDLWSAAGAGALAGAAGAAGAAAQAPATLPGFLEEVEPRFEPDQAVQADQAVPSVRSDSAARRSPSAIRRDAAAGPAAAASLGGSAGTLDASQAPVSRSPAAVPAERVIADTPDRPLFADRGFGSLTDRMPIVVGAAILGLALVVGVVGAYLLLPSASVVITPRVATIGPIPLTVTADPSRTEPDQAAKAVPALTQQVDVDASQTFQVTGKRVEETTATGSVRFRNKDFTSTNTIPKGSVVSTQSGIRFRTDRTITIARAQLVGLQIFPASASVKVTAVKAGTDGNVEPNTILVIPRGEDPLTLDVTNPDATTGGKHDEFPRVVQADLDAAQTALKTQLATSFQDKLHDPSIAAPGTTVFPETGTLGEPTYDVDPASLLGHEVASFDLRANATGTVLAVDESAVASVASADVATHVDGGYTLVDGSSKVDASPGVVDAGVITFPVTITAKEMLTVDPDAIETEIRGKTLDEAQAILARYGSAQVSVWPDWVGSIPTLDLRVDVRTASPPADPPASPEASP